MQEVTYKGGDFKFTDTPQCSNLIKEIFFDNYRVFASGMKFEKGDIVLDLGANEGLFSILMAKLFPVKVVAFEPVRRTFGDLLKNMEINAIGNEIEAHFLGVAEKRGRLDLYVHNGISGASSNHLTPNRDFYTDNIEVITLDDAIMLCGGQIKLLKIDIEGGEYDAFYGSEALGRVDNIVGEFHINQRLRNRGFSINQLAEYLAGKTNLVYYEARDLWE